ncbi:type IX secretion system sortase PorU [Chitinophaga sp. 22321]|uniref:Type IX secretion system sortase PorU n=1 Tax=Chitinophaga hostae TaxID=2831022 RepID=A0ABS5J0D4_9BACT|nr:type IX secretion system sortase PorU [Chitinophaga hostae]MBS0028655.1 type IX secretion system sortase PorU [Chitinophaga hostae]
MKLNYIFIGIMLVFFLKKQEVYAQSSLRQYKKHSILAAGAWYKLAVAAPGVYKIDVAFLKSMGIGTQQLKTAAIRIFGTGGRMLGEPNNTPRYDDLPELALQASDGGDGYLDGSDYLLFYAPGPDGWQFNPSSGTFNHQHHLYADKAWYYLTVGGEGLRIQTDTNPPATGIPEYAFDYHTFYERDSINFLNSGKQWWGQEFSQVVGLSRSYRFTLPAAPAGPVKVNMRVAARSSGGCNFNVAINNVAAISNLYLLPVTDNIFEGVATAATGSGTANTARTELEASVVFSPNNINDKGWLDYLEVQARCALVMPAAGVLDFRSALHAGSGQNSRFALHNADVQTKIWDVTDPLKPISVISRQEGDSLLFTGENDRLHEYVAFRDGAALLPVFEEQVPNQDLHGNGAADMIIITTPALQGPAERLAAMHRAMDQLSVQVTTVDQVYNEFASGSPEPGAIRDYVKMFYDRRPAPRYLLLFGAASYDYRQRIKNNTNDVPSWQSEASLDAIRSYVSDDYFGILKDGGDITQTGVPDLLDIGIGRIPARNASEANLAVDKIIRYRQPAGFGPWRNQVALLADDEDSNLHFKDAEKMGAILTAAAPVVNTEKIYLDAYPQEAGAGGATYPQVNKAIANRINRGTLILNYAGHGSSSRLAAENIMDGNSIKDWHNDDKLPLFITATCDFAPYDDPGITSLGHKILLQQSGGAIALMTTTRAVFAASNQLMNANYLKVAFTPGADGRMPALGTAAMLAKNATYSGSADAINNRKFQLLGDPALTLAFPTYKVVTDSINGKEVAGTDTVKGLGQYTIKGHITDARGNAVTDYNGMLYTTVFDQASLQKTRGNDAGSEVAAYPVQRNVLFQGTQTVANGRFSVTFVAPQDIREGNGKGKVSYYTSNDQLDGNGYFDNFATGGIITGPAADATGPAITAWLDNRQFRNGDITGPDPLLIIDMADSSGINISGNNDRHSITALLDSAEYIVLNDYFEAALNSYKKGSILFPLSGLSTGEHRITIKAWDSYNNFTTTTIYFKVTEQGALSVEEVRNYPNPFRDVTRFTFLHNQQGEELQLTLQVFTVAGSLVKTLHSTIISTAGRYDGMPWDGRDDSGAKLSSGLYLYRLTIRTTKKTKIMGGKLVLL